MGHFCPSLLALDIQPMVLHCLMALPHQRVVTLCILPRLEGLISLLPLQHLQSQSFQGCNSVLASDWILLQVFCSFFRQAEFPLWQLWKTNHSEPGRNCLWNHPPLPPSQQFLPLPCGYHLNSPPLYRLRKVLFLLLHLESQILKLRFRFPQPTGDRSSFYRRSGHVTWSSFPLFRKVFVDRQWYTHSWDRLAGPLPRLGLAEALGSRVMVSRDHTYSVPRYKNY